MKVISTMFKFVAGLTVGTAMALAPVGVTHAAAGASVFVNPGSGTYAKGSTFAVAIYENSGDNDVDSARANLTYDAGKLEATGISGGDFTTCLSAPSASGGTVSTGDCTILGGKKRGQQLLATVTFKAVAEGVAAVNFSSAKVVNNGTDLPATTTNGSFTVSAPAAGGQGGGSSSGGSTGGSSNGGSGSAQRMATTGNAGAVTPAAQPATPAPEAGKVESAAETKEAKDAAKKADEPQKSDDQKAEAATGKRSTWPWIILLLIAVTAAIYVYRKRDTESGAPETDSVKDAKTAKKPAPAAVKTDDVPVAAKADARKGSAQSKGHQSRGKNRSGKHTSNKRSR